MQLWPPKASSSNSPRDGIDIWPNCLSQPNVAKHRQKANDPNRVEEISYEAPDRADKHAVIDAAFVRQRLDSILEKQDLSKFIL